MGETSKLSAIREALVAFASSIYRTRSASSSEVIDLFVRSHEAEIAAAAAEIKNIGLQRLLNDGSKRRLKSQDVFQPSLFNDLEVPALITLPKLKGDGQRTAVRQSVLGISMSQLRAAIEYKKRPRRATSARYKEIEALERLLAAMEPILTDDMSVEEGLKILNQRHRSDPPKGE